MDRRTFLRSLCGTATALWVLGACSKEEAADRGAEPGGTFAIPETATTEPEAAGEVLGGDQFVFDVQTHLLEFEDDGPSFGEGFPQADCGIGDDWRDCFRTDVWLDLIFGHSDTAMALLSAIPVVADPDPLSVAVMDRARRQADALGCHGRVLLSGQVFPSIGRPEDVLEGMAATADRFNLSVWKVYTHTAGDPWRLDDGDRDLPRVGEVFLDGVRQTGVPVVAVHKGLGDHTLASPVDVGPVAAANPDIAFWVYHSGYESDREEGPYQARDSGTDRLITSVRDAGLGPGSNVYAELGSTWFNLMRSPDQAAHTLGKLLSRLGPHNVLWGTDSIWYGSPQQQIEAFRAFEISEQLQEEHGYPDLTAEVKAKVLGANAARVLDIEPVGASCGRNEGAEAGALAPAGMTLGPETAAAARSVFAADHPWS